MIIKIKTYPDAGAEKTEIEFDDAAAVRLLKALLHAVEEHDMTDKVSGIPRAIEDLVP